jgi:ribosomal protein S18 acetylase RimI-like enzyme
LTGGHPRHSASVKLRRAEPGDLDGLDALEREIFSSALFAGHLISRGGFRRFLGSEATTIIVAEIAARLSGYVLVLYRSNSRFARMYSIGVARHARRRGLARMLLAAAEKDAIAHGRGAMRLEVRADDRGAIGLYETSGYDHCGRRPGYYAGRVDAVMFEKLLRKESWRRPRKPSGKEPRQRS